MLTKKQMRVIHASMNFVHASMGARPIGGFAAEGALMKS